MNECLGENTAVAFADGVLEPAVRPGLVQHVASCPSCRKLVALLIDDRSATAAPWSGEPTPGRVDAVELSPGERAGRYIVQGVLGRGGMGVVYDALDPELNRPVALKLLRAEEDAAWADRLRVEAQALAKVPHPNVVAVYDVGDIRGRIFIAMERVDGQTLREWVKSERPTAAQTIAAYLQAGAGLAAAHRAGLVHRDFKPDNALIGSDGRVRVTDFGLVRASPSAPPRPEPDGLAQSTAGWAGTPAYMAPEQFEENAADARSDQFSFCVSLYEALTGERPFTVSRPDSLIAERPLWQRDAKGKLPKRLFAALARGLETRPEDRFETLDALLAALSSSQRRRRVPLAAGAVAAALLVAGTYVVARGTAAPTLCAGGAERFAQAWSTAASRQVEARFRDSGAPAWKESFEDLERRLTTYGQQWAAMYQASCAATRLRGEQSDAVLEVRSRCLDRRLGEVRAVAAVLSSAEATAETVASAVDVTRALTPVETCARVDALLAPVPLPERQEQIDEARQIEALLSTARAHRFAGQFQQGVTIAEEAVRRAQVLGHAPTQAEALEVLGDLQGEAGEPKKGADNLRAAFEAGQVGRHDLASARAAVALVYVHGFLGSRYDEGLQWAWHADVALRRAGGAPDLEALLEANVGHLHYAKGDFPKAREHYQRSLDQRLRLFGGPHLLIAAAYHNLGRVVMAQGDNGEALALSRKAHEVLEQAVTPQHPRIATSLSGLGTILFNQGAYDEALTTWTRALAVAEAALPSGHIEQGRILISLGYALSALGRPNDALENHRRALAIFERRPENAPLTAAVWSGIGEAQLALGRRKDALESYQRARALRERALGAEHEEVASSLQEIAAVLLDENRAREALELYEKALEIRVKSAGADYFENAFAHQGIGTALRKLHRSKEAVASLEKAEALLVGYDGDPENLARIRFELAQALADTGGARTRIRRLLRSAERGLATVKDPDPSLLRQIRSHPLRDGRGEQTSTLPR